ncbi:MAG: hypothetical protein ABI978_03640 [Chloroflexota bacterium]
MSCRQARRELLEHFLLGEELGSRSAPLLAHLDCCADCRREMGIDRELVENLRHALRERVEGGAASASSWGLVRRRTVDRSVRPWTVRVLHWGGIASAAAAGIVMFAVATAPEMWLFPGPQPPFVASAARRAVSPVEEARGWPLTDASTYRAAQVEPPFPGWPMQPQMPDTARGRDGEPPINGRMR